MTATSAFRDRIRRVNDAPAVLFSLLLMTFLLGLSVAIVHRDTPPAHPEGSATVELVPIRADYGQWAEFTAQASGIGPTFTPINEFPAVLEKVGLNCRRLPPTITG